MRVESIDDGRRLDVFLADRLALPRNRVQRWVREGLVRIDGRPVRASHLVSGDETIEVEVPLEPTAAEPLQPEPGPLCVLHEDADLVVVDKHPGLVVHPGAGRSGGTLANRLLARYPELVGIGHPRRPGIVHRLDRGTSGVLVVARSERAYRSLTADFAARKVGKLYLALAWGVLEPATVERPIGRHTQDRKRMTVLASGRPSVSEILPLATAAGGAVSAAVITLRTGRTHQIRVHLQHLRHPLVGDPVYGEARWRSLPTTLRSAVRDFPRPALHAWVLRVRHPADGSAARFEAPVPRDLRELWSALGGDPAVLSAAPRVLDGEARAEPR